MAPNNDEVLFAIGQLHTRLLSTHAPADLNSAEFKIFSQFGEDGIIQYLLQQSGKITDEFFVEIGVEDYSESNTRFLLTNNNWRGIIIDGGNSHIRGAGERVGWRHAVDAVQSFVTAGNINTVLPDEPIGLLSIDVDGNDYWLWEAVACTPQMIVVEYNSLFGPHAFVSIPYDPNFHWIDAHWSRQYHGASLAALDHLAKRKGYQLVGGTTEGVNAFFIREDCLGSLKGVSAADAWRPSRFRTARDRTGVLTSDDGHRARLTLIEEMPLVDVRSGAMTTVGAECSSERA